MPRLPNKNAILITSGLIALLFLPVAFMVAYQDKTSLAGGSILTELEEKGKIFKAEISKTPPPADIELSQNRIDENVVFYNRIRAAGQRKRAPSTVKHTVFDLQLGTTVGADNGPEASCYLHPRALIHHDSLEGPEAASLEAYSVDSDIRLHDKLEGFTQPLAPVNHPLPRHAAECYRTLPGSGRTDAN